MADEAGGAGIVLPAGFGTLELWGWGWGWGGKDGEDGGGEGGDDDGDLVGVE